MICVAIWSDKLQTAYHNADCYATESSFPDVVNCVKRQNVNRAAERLLGGTPRGSLLDYIYGRRERSLHLQSSNLDPRKDRLLQNRWLLASSSPRTWLRIMLPWGRVTGDSHTLFDPFSCMIDLVSLARKAWTSVRSAARKFLSCIAPNYVFEEVIVGVIDNGPIAMSL